MSKPVVWTLAIHYPDNGGTEIQVHTSLSSLVKSLSLQPVPDTAWVVFKISGKVIYKGYWGEGLPTTPTL